MFDNIDEKLRVIAKLIFIITLLGGILWLCTSLYNIVEYKDFLVHETFMTDYHTKAISAKNGIIYSVILIISGAISSFILYGFSDLIYYVKNINNKLNNKNTNEVISENKND